MPIITTIVTRSVQLAIKWNRRSKNKSLSHEDTSLRLIFQIRLRESQLISLARSVNRHCNDIICKKWLWITTDKNICISDIQYLFIKIYVYLIFNLTL